MPRGFRKAGGAEGLGDLGFVEDEDAVGAEEGGGEAVAGAEGAGEGAVVDLGVTAGGAA